MIRTFLLRVVRPYVIRMETSREYTIEKVPVGEPTPCASPVILSPHQRRVAPYDYASIFLSPTRAHNKMPILDELIPDLNGATVFIKLDLSSGYPQLELHPSCRNITTSRTHNDLYMCERPNFGISSASEIFQEHIRKVISQIEPMNNISDDILWKRRQRTGDA